MGGGDAGDASDAGEATAIAGALGLCLQLMERYFVGLKFRSFSFGKIIKRRRGNFEEQKDEKEEKWNMRIILYLNHQRSSIACTDL